MSGKVLIVDDSVSAREALKEALKNIFSSFIEADNGVAALKAFSEEKPGFVITDVEMPSINGFRLIAAVRGMADGKDIPIIMYSAKKQALKDKLKGLTLGASDFLIKPFENEELVARVKSFIRMRDLMDELKEKNALLERLALTDPLTGLYNRRHFYQAIKEQMALGLRHNFRIACLLIDIDHFKNINDTWGHIAGDEVLKEIGRLLDENRRAGELVARFGGEEFIICLFNIDYKKTVLAAKRFNNVLKKHEFSSRHHPPLHITISMGVASFPQDEILTIDELIKAADTALYKAKAGGRDRVVFHGLAEADGENPEIIVNEEKKQPAEPHP